MAMYDANSFSTKLIEGYAESDRKMITRGVQLGWKLRIGKAKCFLLSYDGRKRLIFTMHSRGGRESGKPNPDQTEHMLVKFADPVRKEELITKLDEAEVGHAVEPVEQAQEHVALPYEVGPYKDPKVTAAEGSRRVAEATAEWQKAHEPVAAGNDAPLDVQGKAHWEGDNLIEHDEPDEPDEPDEYPIRRPLLAHYARGEGDRPGKSYRSQSIIEREWEDGHIDYECAYLNCTSGPNGTPYSAPRKMSVASHRKVHIKAGVVAPDHSRDTTGKVEDPSYMVSSDRAKPRRRVKQKDADYRRAWVQAPSGEVSYESRQQDQSEPLTAEQVLDKIRGLVDRGKYVEQQEALSEAQAAAAEALEAKAKLEIQYAEALAEVDRLRQSFMTFAELAQGELGSAARRAVTAQNQVESNN